MANLLGIKQITLQKYNELSQQERQNFLFLVRDMSGTTNNGSYIFFGNRKYAADDKKVLNLIAALGTAINDDGTFNGFTAPSLSGATSFTEVIEILETAIGEGASSLEEIKTAIGETEPLSGQTIGDILTRIGFIRGDDI